VPGIVELTPEQVLDKYPVFYEIFFKVEEPRKPGEGLHDYFTRKGIKCFCPPCRKAQRDLDP
jgi:hypothetical protein